MVSFSNFSTTDTRQWSQTKRNLEHITVVLDHMKTMNAILMAMQPIQWYAYSDYIKATEKYVESLHLECLANDPGLYVGETRNYHFYFKEVSHTQEGYRLKNGRIVHLTDKLPQDQFIDLRGYLVKISSNYYELKGGDSGIK